MCFLFDNYLLIGIKGDKTVICKEQKVGVKEPFHTAFEAVCLGQTVTNKEDRGVCLRKHSKGHLRQLGVAENIQNKMPHRKDSRSGLHKRFEPVSTEKEHSEAGKQGEEEHNDDMQHSDEEQRHEETQNSDR